MRIPYRFALLMTALALLIALSFSLTRTQAEESPLMHNSRDLVYRDPRGAVPAGTTVTLRIRTKQNAFDIAVLRLYDGETQQESYANMEKALSTPDGYDFWEYKLTTPNHPTLLYYRFLLRKGDVVVYYEDDTKDSAGTYDISRKGGPGTFYTTTHNQNWQVTVYAPDFQTPQWIQNAVIYQIFPDRFRNGDKSNDPADGSQTFYGSLKLTFHKTWNEQVTDFKSNPSLQPNSDFFGGDLKGIEDKLPYLKQLGVTAIYLNPIFEARSNHRYDTADYKKIDPILGAQADWDSLVKAANAQGIHLILDGVFNHVSSDGLLFDRYHRFSGGACGDLNSKYRGWFTFQTPRAPNDTSNGCVDDGKGDTAYISWAGYDSIPKLNSANPDVRAFIFGAPDSVARTWIKAGASGWRLDVANEIDDGGSANTYWEDFRKAVKETDPNAVIIGEFWDDASTWLTGTQMDSSMNYRMRSAILPFTIISPYADNDASWQPYTPSQFDGAIQAMLEDYPPQAMAAMMNLLDSHDTSRLSYVTNFSQSHKFAATLQFAMPGAPTIYYGDEIRLQAPDVNGQDDPYNRAPYPWPDETGSYYPAPDNEMLAFYTKLGQVRAANPVLADGAYRTLLTDDKDGLYAFLRSPKTDDTTTKGVALVVANRSTGDHPFSVDVSCLNEGTTLTDALAGGTLTVKSGAVSGTISARTAALYVTPDAGACGEFNTPLAAIPATAPSLSAAMTVFAGDGKVVLDSQVLNLPRPYDVYRSYFPDAGFVKLTEKPVTGTFEDTSVTNGLRYYYYLADRAGVRTKVVSAVPAAFIAKVNVITGGSAKIQEPLSAKGIAVTGDVTFDSPNVQTVQAQMALAGANAALGDQPVTWQTLDPQSGTGTITFNTTLRASAPGGYLFLIRFSADAGASWTQASRLPVTITAPVSTGKPATPANLKIGDVGMFQAWLTWDAVPGAYAYRIYRGGLSDRALIAETTATKFRDYDVFPGQQYPYSVTAIDESLNESGFTPIQVASVANQEASMTFRVSVPDTTPADSPVYIAGDFGTKDYPTWSPGANNMKMKDKGNHTWEITLKLPTGATVQYKYVRGDWSAVEKGKGCEEIANRTLFVKPGDSVQADTVPKWADIDKCS